MSVTRVGEDGERLREPQAGNQNSHRKGLHNKWTIFPSFRYCGNKVYPTLCGRVSVPKDERPSKSDVLFGTAEVRQRPEITDKSLAEIQQRRQPVNDPVLSILIDICVGLFCVPSESDTQVLLNLPTPDCWYKTESISTLHNVLALRSTRVGLYCSKYQQQTTSSLSASTTGSIIKTYPIHLGDAT